jgi:hypothetical protein
MQVHLLPPSQTFSDVVKDFDVMSLSEQRSLDVWKRNQNPWSASPEGEAQAGLLLWDLASSSPQHNNRSS